ncbi:DUF4282 domain-containing protein [Agilicoccus flavus]|uniref:DUF4282 domain-containing protein n=1 Tax=Agilicoccus flavus TaxID=2775968 RepID=UPI001CF6301F|nr:DUF4282 domain-containing protein [Agilicoccus flavus]
MSDTPGRGRDENPGERVGRPQPHPGWSAQSQESYEAGDSGGWGGPRPNPTGPLPRLRRTPDDRVTYAAAQGYGDTDPGRAEEDPNAPHGAHTAGAPDAAPDGGDASDPGDHPHEHDHGDPHADDRDAWGDPAHPPRSPAAAGAAALFDLSFRRTATFSIVPFTYVVVLVFLVLDYMRSIYDYSSAAGSIGPGALGGLLILFVVGLFKIVVLASLARLALELCRHVAELAHDRRGEQEWTTPRS